jgi:hypothetical protein
MEITIEITKEEYQSYIKQYYLKRNWTKRIAILAIIAFALSVFTVISTKSGWKYLPWDFLVLAAILIILFFILPYVALYVQMLSKQKKVGANPIIWHYKISDDGVQIDDEHGSKFLSRGSLANVKVTNDFIVFSSQSGQLYFLPLSALENNDREKISGLITNYRNIPEVKSTITPKRLYFIGVLCLVPFLGGAIGVVWIIMGITQYKDKLLIGMGAVGVIITGCIFYGIIHANNIVSEYDKIDPQTKSTTLPKDYLKLFGGKDTLSSIRTLNSKLRAPISDFIYKNYHCLIYKIDSVHGVNVHLDKIIKETYNDNPNNYGSYNGVLGFGGGLSVWLQMAVPDKPSQIYLNLFGDNTHIIAKNDSVVYYSSNLKNFYIKYKPTGGEEFYGKASQNNDDDAKRFPVELMFLKRDRKLYFMLTYSDGPVLPSGTLYSFITKNN